MSPSQMLAVSPRALLSRLALELERNARHTLEFCFNLDAAASFRHSNTAVLMVW